MLLSSFNYTISRISGEDNVLADLLTRWGAPPVSEIRTSAILEVPVLSELDPDFKWPSLKDVKLAQQEAIKADDTSAPKGSRDGVFVTTSGAVWIPESASLLHVRLLIVGHCGHVRHREKDATAEAI